MPRKRVSGKKVIDGLGCPDRRLTEGGVWRRKIAPSDRVRILKVGVADKGLLRDETMVRWKPFEGGSGVNFIVDDFLFLFEPVLSAVRKD